MKAVKLFEVNYIYFSALFISLIGVHGYSLLLLKGVSLVPLFVTVFLQCSLEAGLLLFLSLYIRKYCHKSFFYLIISLSCILLLAHEADFIMTRLMGVSIWFLLHLISYEIGDNFLEMIKSTNLPYFIWIIGAIGAIALFISGLFFFHATERMIKKRKFFVSSKTLTLFVIVPLILMGVWDKLVTERLSYVSYLHFREILPFKSTFFRPSHLSISMDNSLREFQFKRETEPQVNLQKKPPIFLFVIESLREDFITKEIAPNLFKFKGENLYFDVAASGGNCSHHSWFTIFHSQFPLRFSKEHISKTKETGSLAISALKDLGYQIHLYSSAELVFYHMDESIFGKGHMLADTYSEFPHGNGLSTAEIDKITMDQLLRDQEKFSGDGHLFIVFLDATHFGYSWPRETCDIFLPVEESINYIKTAFNKGSVEGIKNRYRNAIYYVDSLIGNFLDHHANDDSVIVFTGDHGEAFYENGKIFHASNLTKEQIHVPLYYKFGKESLSLKDKASKISSHIDIFPTLLDYIDNKDAASFGLEGESIFKPIKWPYTITSRYNGGKAPFEFCLQSVNGRMILHTDKKETLKIISDSSSESTLFVDEAKVAFLHLFPQK